MDFDTIAGISTPIGEGGIAVIRVSGDRSIELVDKIFCGKTSLKQSESHTIHYGFLVDPSSNERFEEVLISVMRSPRTFTKEDVVEVNCHGGFVSSRRVLDALLEVGVRLAEPGEFTKRAFLNGRIDLSQAEAVMDLIRAKSDRAMKVAMRQVEGRLSKKIQGIRHKIVQLMAHIEVTIDYPEHDVEEVTYQLLKDQTSLVKKEVEDLLVTASQGKILREGLSTAIIGRPNVGKSSLLNALVQESKSIVTDIPGTTRDIIEEYIQVRGVPLKLIDTAGIRSTEDIVEKLGVERSRKALDDADLILLMFNFNEPLNEDDIDLIHLVKDLPSIAIINKMDLPERIEIDVLRRSFSEDRMIMTSVIEDQGIDQLEEKISDLFFEGKIQGDDLTYVSNSRHIDLLKKSLISLDEAINSIEAHLPIDMIQIDLKAVWEQLGEVIGDSVSEDLIDQIFAQFCLGK